MTKETAPKRREEIFDEIAQDYGGLAGFASLLNESSSQLSRNVFCMLDHRSEYAEEANSVMIELQIYEFRKLRDACDERVRRLIKNLEAFKSAEDERPSETWWEARYGRKNEQHDEQRENAAGVRA